MYTMCSDPRALILKSSWEISKEREQKRQLKVFNGDIRTSKVKFRDEDL